MRQKLAPSQHAELLARHALLHQRIVLDGRGRAGERVDDGPEAHDLRVLDLLLVPQMQQIERAYSPPCTAK